MRSFTESDVVKDTFNDGTPHWYIRHSLNIERDDFIDDPLWWHKENLINTRELQPTRLKINFNGRLYRIYAIGCSCNNPSTFFTVRGQKIFVG